MMRSFLAMLVASFATISSAFATPDPAAYNQMVQAKLMVEMIKMPAPPEAIREAMLKEARPEDLAFIKSMLVHWKKNSTQNLSAEFNHVILRDESGSEVLHMVPVENSKDKFEINGRVWTAPEKGSISASLAKHLSQKSDAASIFDLVSRAYAAEDFSKKVRPAIYYVMATQKPTLGDIAATHIKMFETSKYFSIQDNFFQSAFKFFGGKAPAVTCGANEASGRLVIGLETMTFKARADGSVVMTPYDSKKTFVATGEGPKQWRAGVKYQACTDADCASTSGPIKNRITSFLKLKTPEEVDVAYTFRPLDGDQKTYPIVFDCPEKNECDHMYIKDREKLSDSDRKEADRRTLAANKALEDAKAAQDEAIMAIRPLFACCQSETCKKQVLGVGVITKTAPAEGAKSTH